MANDNFDILLDPTGDDKVVNGDFAIGDGTLDDCQIILKTTTGCIHSDPIMGVNLVSMMNAKGSPDAIIKAIGLNLKRDNKNPKTLKIVNGEIKLEL